ncbi:hypothetical protein [Breoghania sp. L-A4]|uniref:hypothetical protein n=1 Tax=Breoghania sp. L-A4 TaxID=2304600 RepID=UPI000E35DE8C|nr:hypothetical protein [Breoghania sp. L-A4]AXS39783.1 hypothetical protein D1F64_06610 [Breoghania sp. L-A4]
MNTAVQFLAHVSFDVDAALLRVDDWFAASLARIAQAALAPDAVPGLDADPYLDAGLDPGEDVDLDDQVDPTWEARAQAANNALLARLRLAHEVTSNGEAEAILRWLDTMSIGVDVPAFCDPGSPVEALMAGVQGRHRVSTSELFGQDKTRMVVDARDALFHGLRHELQWSVGQIARWYSAHRIGAAGQTGRATVRKAVARHEGKRVSE